jgi:enterobactin synthetase component D
MPKGFVGSISHKDTMAVAFAAVDKGVTVGLDLEHMEPPRPRIARKILTPAEQLEVHALPEVKRWMEILLRFSLKEAIYKAIDPRVQRYVTFKEVEVRPDMDGKAQARLNLTGGEQLDVALRWVEENGWLLTLAEARIPSRP